MILFILLFMLVPATVMADGDGGWQSLAPGIDLRTHNIIRPNSPGDSQIIVVRIDPNLWDLELMGVSLTGDPAGQTARGWCKSHNLSAAINAGMFGTDFRTHVGYLQSGSHLNNGRINHYQSVAAFDPEGDRELPRFRIFDLDSPGVSMQAILKDYTSAVQNLRLIKRPGLNRWSQQNKRWSEAALGEDDAGRILFVFCRLPLSMHDLNTELLGSGIGLIAAQHLEGGPQAQLYLSIGDVELEMSGVYSAYFGKDHGSLAAWPIPNVLGIRPRPSPTAHKD